MISHKQPENSRQLLFNPRVLNHLISRPYDVTTGLALQNNKVILLSARIISYMNSVFKLLNQTVLLIESMYRFIHIRHRIHSYCQIQGKSDNITMTSNPYQTSHLVKVIKTVEIKRGRNR